MARMKIVPIEQYEDSYTYYYTCPFCGKENACIDCKWDGCDHLIFGYEDINRRILAFDSDLQQRIREILLSKRVNFLEGLYEFWRDEFKPQDRRSEDPETWDEAKENAIDEYLKEYFSLDDFKKVLRYSDLKPMTKDLVIAETEDDPFGFGKTSFVLWKGTV